MENRFEAIAERWLDVKLRGPVEFMASCPWCNGTESLQFNTSKGLWLCFKCEKRGTAESLVRSLGGSYSAPEVAFEDLETQLRGLQVSRQAPGASSVVLPESLLARYKGKPHEHWTGKRKYTLDTIREWGLGYDPLSDRCTIPYRNPDGDLLGVIYRRLDDQFPRYTYPKGFDRTGSLFGSWMVSEGRVGDGGSDSPGALGLVEGSTDAIWVSQCRRPAVAQYGSNLHPRQVRLLRRLGVKEVVLFYDYDPAGVKATKQAPEVLDGFIVRSVQWDTSRYCWHAKLCGCDEGHSPLNLGQCPKDKQKKCRCGRMHDVDPNKLPERTVRKMFDSAELVGRPRWSSTDSRRSARGKTAQRRR